MYIPEFTLLTYNSNQLFPHIKLWTYKIKQIKHRFYKLIFILLLYFKIRNAWKCSFLLFNFILFLRWYIIDTQFFLKYQVVRIRYYYCRVHEMLCCVHEILCRAHKLIPGAHNIIFPPPPKKLRVLNIPPYFPTRKIKKLKKKFIHTLIQK